MPYVGVQLSENNCGKAVKNGVKFATCTVLEWMSLNLISLERK